MKISVDFVKFYCFCVIHAGFESASFNESDCLRVHSNHSFLMDLVITRDCQAEI
jgi:hypothetical protein